MIDFGKLFKSFKYALAGLRYSVSNNQNIKIHLLIACLVLAAGLLLNFDKEELLAVGVMTVMVLAAEMINTTVEEVVNLLVSEHREEAKTAKDVAAGMVLLIAIFASVVGFFIFMPHILALFK